MRYLLFVTFLGLTFSLSAQRPGPPESKGEIFGSVVDSISGESMAYVTVMALSGPDDKLIAGAISEDNGSFSLTSLATGTYKLKISFVGYKVKFIEGIVLDDNQITFNTKDLQLAPLVMDVVEVVGGVPDITYEIDKKIVNVEDQINTDGQSALEVLQNVPSITVAADGTVSLRGSSSFTLLIDGIPTLLNASDALSTIPASTIQDIEIITNPSARYQAEGTSGIINIITKKSKLEGVSLLVNGNYGNFGNYGGDIALNIKKKSFTFDINANYNMRSRPNDNVTERITTYDSVVNILRSEGESNWKRGGWGIGGGVQWAPNNSHVLVLKSDLRSNLMQPYSDFNYQNIDVNNLGDSVLLSSFYNEQHNNIDFLSSNASLFYQHNIKRNRDHNISFETILSFRDVQQFDTTLSYLSDGTIRSGNLYTETGPSNFVRFNLDYRLPLKHDRKFEAGLQTQFGASGDVGKNYVYNTSTAEFDFNPLFSSDVKYQRDIHAAYSMISGKHKGLGYQVGLRAEYTYRTISSSTAADFATINRLDWFPSAHFSYSLDNKSQVLLSYSRRIERPRSYYFEPFITWEDPFNVRTGNPNLTPEYINAFEMSFIKPLAKKGFASVEAYFRKSNGIINRISTVYEEGILISQPFNIGTSESYGLEGSLSYDLAKWWKINAGVNVYYFDLSGELNDVDYSAKSLNYNGRLTNTFNLKGGYMLQLVTSYRSGSVTAQGESLDSFSQDISLKKTFWQKKLGVTLQGRNIFGTDRRGNISYTQNVYINSLSKPLAPQLTLSVSLKLNNYQKVFDRNGEMDDF
ncbi:TonB-dependent receptor [Crocinitomix sp.]|nr:TonB-dependent receptor [Crocinitomix sp.]